jgi:hypothetical protein
MAKNIRARNEKTGTILNKHSEDVHFQLSYWLRRKLQTMVPEFPQSRRPEAEKAQGRSLN